MSEFQTTNLPSEAETGNFRRFFLDMALDTVSEGFYQDPKEFQKLVANTCSLFDQTHQDVLDRLNKTEARKDKFVWPANSTLPQIFQNFLVDQKYCKRFEIDGVKLLLKERKSLIGMAQGTQCKATGTELTYSKRSIQSFRQRTFGKLGVSNLSDALRYAFESGLLTVSEVTGDFDLKRLNTIAKGGELTERENEVAQFLANNSLKSKTIETGIALGISKSTVESHLQNIFNKLNLNMTSLTSFYLAAQFSGTIKSDASDNQEEIAA
jgi:DNA-binding NarL/FixJ family response regulator